MLKIIILLLLLSSNVFGEQINKAITKQLQQILYDITQKYDFSAAELSIYSPKWKRPISIYEGYTCNSCQEKIDEKSLFQIGSITKTFISYIILQLINDNTLNQSDNLGKLLPEYPQWKFVTIRDLLNNTSGIASYDKSFLWWWRVYLDPTYYWTSEHLISIINMESRLVIGYSSFGHNMSQINMSSFQASGAVLSNAFDISIWYAYYSNYIINGFFPSMFVQTNPNQHLLYGVAVFSMLTKYGVIFFTPGLMPGYTSMAIWLPRYNISVVYILNRNLVKKNIHVEIIGKILPIISKNLLITSKDIQWNDNDVQNLNAIVSSFE